MDGRQEIIDYIRRKIKGSKSKYIETDLLLNWLNRAENYGKKPKIKGIHEAKPKR